MSMSSRTETRNHTVAHQINAHLPANYQKSIFEEGLRVNEVTLAPRALSERRILIVGGAGYIGSVLTGHLLSRGYKVRCLDNNTYHNDLSLLSYAANPDFEFFRADLCDENALFAALEGVTDAILLAGLVGDPITKNFPDAARRVNDDGHDLMLRCLARARLNKVIFVSTCSNYGLIEGDRLADEEFELNPLSLYAKSKVRVEKQLLDPAENPDYTPTVLRFATAFGLSPRMRFDLTISEFTRDMFLGNDLLVFDADTWRPYCHVQDFSEVIRRVLEAPRDSVAFEVFNAGGDTNNFTKQMIVDAILDVLPDARVRYQEHGSDPRNYRVNFGKIRERLYFDPGFTVADGIEELVRSLRQGLFHKIDVPESYYGNWKPDIQDAVI